MGRKTVSKEQDLNYLIACGHDLSLFASEFCKGLAYEDIPEFHKEIYLLLRNERLVLAAPRGFAKSSIIAKIYPLFLGLYKIRKDICIISASETLAIEHLRYIKSLVESDPKIIYFFGDLRSEKWTENHLILKHHDGTRINIRAKGAGGQIRGFRPDCIVLDDIETDESVESEEQRKKLKNWLFKACLNTLLPGGQFLLIGTVIHPLSVLADLLGTPNGWVKKKFTAYKDGIEAEGHELWPGLWSHERLQQRKREIGSWAFAAEYMNDPKSDEANPIKETYLRYWESLPSQLSTVIAVDPAYSEDESADFKVCSHIGLDQNHNRYLVEYVRNHDAVGHFQDAIINMFLRNKGTITAVGIPCSGPEKAFYDSFLKRCQERGVHPPVVELKNSFQTASGGSVRSKKQRIIAALQPHFEQGRYYIHESHFEAREELLTIGSSRWDDLVDTMAYAEQILTPGFNSVSSKMEMTQTSNKHAGYGIEY